LVGRGRSVVCRVGDGQADEAYEFLFVIDLREELFSEWEDIV
jgi:hypothetical protein